MSKKRPKRSTKSTGSKSQTKGAADAVPFDRRAMEGLMQQLVPGATSTKSRVNAAQQIMYQAFEATSPQRQITLARKALELSPDCADAYVMLADYAETLPEALELYEEGVAAGERALGAKGFEEYEGHFWGFLETRPYMRAREGLADCLWKAGRRDEAAEHCREMLRLNPNDNQGIRYRLVSMLLDLERLDELEKLLKKYEEDGSAEWAYARALLAFRREGDSDGARKALNAAMEVNKHVPVYLARLKPMPRQLPEYITFGGEDEAIGCVAQYLPAWRDTPGATEWLRRTLNLAPAARPKKSAPPWSKLRKSLAELPQREDEVWELDLRAAAASGDAASSWMLTVYNTTDDRIIEFGFFDDRPKDVEVWRFLLGVLGDPQDGEPRRPGVVGVARKTWLKAWQRKLQDIGIECRLGEVSSQLNAWLESAAKEVEKSAQFAGEDGPDEEDWSALVDLPQGQGEIWQAVVKQLPTWIQIAGESKRPWICLVVDSASEAILATQIEMDEPSDDWILKGVWQAMNAPTLGEARRPSIIHVETDQQRTTLEPRLEKLGIRCARKKGPVRLQQLIDDMAMHLAGPQQRTALIHSPGVTTAQLGGFFEAAAAFYRARPWREIPGDSVIRVECDRFKSGPWYAVVMGQSGIEQGFALYEDIELLSALLSNQLSDEEYGRRTSAISVTYGERVEIAPADLDEIEKHDWPVAGQEAYPCVLRVNPGMALRTPLKWELELLEGCLRAIPAFLQQHVSKANIECSVSGETVKFQLERIDD